MNEHVANSFLAGFHAQFGVSPNVVMGLAERATGDTVVQARRIVDGYDNEVYRVILASGRAVYPRIRRGGEGGVGGEVWAMDQARRAGVPVPEVVTAGTVATEEGDLDAMVVAEAPGRPLANLLPSPSPPLRRAAMENLGRVLGVLHSIRTPGAWRPSDGGRWPDPAQVHQWFVAGRVRDRDDLVAAGLEVEEVEEVEELLHQSWDPAEHATPVLCHRDVSPDHVFVDADLRVTGLIDWDMWQGGPPTHDLANVALRKRRLRRRRRRSRWRSLAEPTFRRAITVSIAGQLSGHLAHHIRIGDTARAPAAVARLRRVVSQLVDSGE